MRPAIADLATRAPDKELDVEELTGGTFTISNGGLFGSLMSTPILDPPQVGILGLRAFQDRPVAIRGCGRITFSTNRTRTARMASEA